MKIRLLLPLSGVSMAQPAGNFIPIGAMTIPRSGYSATLLPNGKVLVASGLLAGPITSSAELYRPAVLTRSPELFAIWHAATGQLVSAAAPVTAGEVLSMGVAAGSAAPLHLIYLGRPSNQLGIAVQ